MKRTIKLTIDILLFALFIYLLGYHIGPGLFMHGIAGSAFIVLLVAHHALNISWYKGLRKGTWPATRVVFTACNMLLLLFTLLVIVSSVLMSGAIFSFSQIVMTQRARDLHIFSTSWYFMLACVHTGLHVHAPLVRLERRLLWNKNIATENATDGNGAKHVVTKNVTSRKIVYYGICVALFAAGAFSFVKSGIWSNLFLLYVMKTPPAHLWTDYTMYSLIAVAVCLAVHFVWNLRGRKKAKNRCIA